MNPTNNIRQITPTIGSLDQAPLNMALLRRIAERAERDCLLAEEARRRAEKKNVRRCALNRAFHRMMRWLAH